MATTKLKSAAEILAKAKAATAPLPVPTPQVEHVIFVTEHSGLHLSISGLAEVIKFDEMNKYRTNNSTYIKLLQNWAAANPGVIKQL